MSKVALAPRNCAEAVALGVSACFLAVAGFVVHGSSTVEPSSTPRTEALAAKVPDGRTESRPADEHAVIGSRVLLPRPPLVLLPLQDQAEARIQAAGTPRGSGAVLVGYSRGTGTLPLGGALAQAGTQPSHSPSRPMGAVGFPTSIESGTVSAAPQPAPSSPSASPTAPATAPTESAPPTTPPDPTTPVVDPAAPTEGPTPSAPSDPTPTPTPTTPAAPGAGSGGGSSNGGTTSGGTGGTGSTGGTSGTSGTSSTGGTGPASGTQSDAVGPPATTMPGDAPAQPSTGPSTAPSAGAGPAPEGVQD